MHRNMKTKSNQGFLSILFLAVFLNQGALAGDRTLKADLFLGLPTGSVLELREDMRTLQPASVVKAEHRYTVAHAPLRGDSIAIFAIREGGEEVIIQQQGLEALSFAKLCRSEIGERIACGSKARAQLINFVSGRVLLCQEQNAQPSNCTVDGVNLSDWLIRSGIARPQTPSAEYANAIAEARESRRGMWADAFVRERTVAEYRPTNTHNN
jgi:endonuclease YncB( thermonuclease family)